MLSLISVLLCFVVVGLYIRPLGAYMAAVYRGVPHMLSRPLAPLENIIYRICGIDEAEEMSWKRYFFSLLVLGIWGIILLFIIFIGQGALPLNPQGFSGLPAHTAFNAAISFVTNTNWQSYSGEVSLSYFSQSVGIVVQMFLSAATGLAVAVALCRAIMVKQSSTIGNFWVDCVRSVLYILLPMAVLFALVLVSQGVVQNYSAYVPYTSLEGEKGVIATGPVALQTAIKMLGTNGGGFFGTNGAHPFENPNAMANLLQIMAIFIIPAAFAYSAGMLLRDRRQGVMMLIAMSMMFFPLLALSIVSETRANPKFDSAFIETSAGNIEGKETRFGTATSALWSAASATTANGSVNSSIGSHMPNSGLVNLVLMYLGEVVFGGVGSGVYGMLIYVLVAVFMAGLMVGRTPEFMGKKLGAFDVQMAMLILLIPAFLSLSGTAIAVMDESAKMAVTQSGSHGFTEILYAYSSATNNNGSAFAGLKSNTAFYDITLGICMFMGRYGLILMVLGVAGSLASKNTTPTSAGTLPTHTFQFAFVLVMVVLLSLLPYVPALAMGPIAEHVHVWGGL